jgi:hypothetical protein
MKLKHINPHNVRHQIPAWAIDPFALAVEMDRQMSQYLNGRSIPRWDSRLKFWFEAEPMGGGWGLRLAEPEPGDETGLCGVLNLVHPEWVISVPLNELLKGAPLLERTHSFYAHTFADDVPLTYFGITKQRWFDRLAQHERSAQQGSPFLFHRALRDKPNTKIVHRVIATLLDHDSAMGLEEEWVEEFGLYPLGLNMIPGGFAGLRYLHTLGVQAKTSRERDIAMEALAARETIDGRVNPLCAARWISDQEYVNRVICGHSERLTVDQVRNIRMFAAAGKRVERIAELVGDRAERVARVIRGQRYSRVA